MECWSDVEDQESRTQYSSTPPLQFDSFALPRGLHQELSRKEFLGAA